MRGTFLLSGIHGKVISDTGEVTSPGKEQDNDEKHFQKRFSKGRSSQCRRIGNGGDSGRLQQRHFRHKGQYRRGEGDAGTDHTAGDGSFYHSGTEYVRYAGRRRCGRHVLDDAAGRSDRV